jgi:drug/metabolite transporter (DMT)-like permease
LSADATSATAGRGLDAAGLLGVIACCALWGGNAVAVKFAVPALPAFGCAGLRYAIALPILAAVCRLAERPLWVERRRLGLLLVHALLTVVQIGTFNWGTGRSLAGRASILINVHPLVVAPMAWLLLGERLGARGLLGLGCAASGVAVLLGRAFVEAGAAASDAGGVPHGDRLGDLVVLLSGVIFGVQTVAQKLTFPAIAPPTLLFAQAAVAVPIFLGYSLMAEGAGAYHFTAESVAGLLYQGLAASGLCYTLWFALLRRYPAGRVATVAFLTPLFGVALSTWLKAEPLTWPLAAGGGLVGLGIYLVASGGGRRVASKGPSR